MAGLTDKDKQNLKEYNELMRQLGEAELSRNEAIRNRSVLEEANLNRLRNEVKAVQELESKFTAYSVKSKKTAEDLVALQDRLNASKSAFAGLSKRVGLATQGELVQQGKNLAALKANLGLREKEIKAQLQSQGISAKKKTLLQQELSEVKKLQAAREQESNKLKESAAQTKKLAEYEKSRGAQILQTFGLYDKQAAAKSIKQGGEGGDQQNVAGNVGKFVGGKALDLFGLGSLKTLIPTGKEKKADDLSGYGARALITPDGVVALNNKDTVIAGTKLFKGDDVTLSPEGSLGVGDAIDGAAATGNPYAKAAKVIKDVGEKMVNIFKPMDTDAGNLARTLNTTYENALQARVEMTQLAAAEESVFVTGKKMAETTIAMNRELGTAVNFDAQRLVQQTKLRNAMKDTMGDTAAAKDLAADVLKTSLATGVSDFEIYKNRLAQIRLLKIQKNANIDERAVLADISKLSSTIKLNYLGQDQALTRAAASARAMGTDLSKIDKTAESLMNFESSIQAQMEAELLTGKTMNLERMRYFALTNDLVGMTSELAAQGITAASYQKMNRIQQEAYAKSLGMSKDDMSEMLLQQEVITKLGTKDLDAAKEKYKQAVLEGKEKQFLADLGDDALATQFKQMSIQDRQMASQEKMAMALEVIAEKMVGSAWSTIVKGRELAAELANAPQAAFAKGGRGTTSYMGAGKEASKETIDLGGFSSAPGYVPRLAEGGLVKQGGAAVVDSGEVFLGKNSIGTLNMMVEEMRSQNKKLEEQNRHLQVIASKNTSISMDGRVVSDIVGQGATTSYGNLLNPASSTFR